MNMLPVKISNREKLARAIFSPFHIKRDKLKTAAFKASHGKKDVSVNRLRALDAHDCKRKAKEIESGDKKYKGFAILSAGIVRNLGSDVEDSREYYWGHADIIHKVVLERGQTPCPEFNYLLQQLVDQSKFYEDPNPVSDNWEGEDFLNPLLMGN